MPKKSDVTMEEIVEKSISILNKNLDNLKTAMELDIIGEFKIARANAMTGLARGVSSILKEARALNKINAEAMTQLGPTEKRRLLVDWFKKQPPESQRTLLYEMTAAHNEGRKSVGKGS